MALYSSRLACASETCGGWLLACCFCCLRTPKVARKGACAPNVTEKAEAADICISTRKQRARIVFMVVIFFEMLCVLVSWFRLFVSKDVIKKFPKLLTAGLSESDPTSNFWWWWEYSQYVSTVDSTHARPMTSRNLKPRGACPSSVTWQSVTPSRA